MLMVTYILSYNIFRYFISYRSCKVSIFPKLSAPQLLFYLRVFSKYLRGRSCLQDTHNLGNRVSWRKGQEYMHMVFCYFHYVYLKFIRLTYLFKISLNALLDICPHYPFSVFRGPYKMVFCIIYSMTCSSCAHAYILPYCYYPLKDNFSSPPKGGVSKLYFS